MVKFLVPFYKDMLDANIGRYPNSLDYPLEASVDLFNQVSFPTQYLKRNWVTFPNDRKCKTRIETSQKSLYKIFYIRSTRCPRL